MNILGVILMLPLFIALVSLLIAFPIYAALRGDWYPMGIIWGTAVIIAMAAVGMWLYNQG